MTVQTIDNHVTIDARPRTEEMRDLARVLKAALGMLMAYWRASSMPAQHPYRQAVVMVISYLENRYRV